MHDRRQVDWVSEPINHGLLFMFLSTLVVACIGLIAFKALGLYNAMESTLGQVIIGEE